MTDTAEIARPDVRALVDLIRDEAKTLGSAHLDAALTVVCSSDGARASRKVIKHMKRQSVR